MFYKIAFCVGVMLMFAMPNWVGVKMIGGAVVCGVLAGWAMWRYRHRVNGRFYLGLGVALCLGAGYAYLRTQSALSHQWQGAAQSHSLTIQITGLPEPFPTYTRFIAQATTETGKIYRLQFQDYQQRHWQVGEHWRVQARVRAAVGTRNQVGFDREAWALANGIDGMASVGKQRFRLPEKSWAEFNGARAQIVQQWQVVSTIYPQGAALMKALAVGDESGLSAQTWAALRPLGLNHLISISGLHITMMAMLAAMLCKWAMRWTRTPRRPKDVSVVVGWLAAVAYTGLAGWEVPALRSLLMLTVMMALWLTRRQGGIWSAYWTAMTAVLLYQPMAVLAVGFWLSFGLVAALVWVLAFRLPENQARNFWQQRYHTLKQAIAGQWAATLIGGVATIYLFGLLPIFSPVVNAVAIPLFSWLLTPLALLASALPSDAPKLVAAYWGEQTIDLLIKLSNWLPETTFTHPPMILFVVAIVACLLILLPISIRLKMGASLGLAMLIVYQPPPVSGSLKATVYDVGQGLAVLLQTPHHTVLYDTGTPAAEFALLPNLRAQGIDKLDHLILSHHDDDHDGGFPAVQKQVHIQNLYAGQPEFYPRAQDCHTAPAWQVDNVTFRFFRLPSSLKNQENKLKDNDLSCILQVQTPHHSLLITGDISQNVERQLIEQYGEQLKSDVFILTHHGSQSSNHTAFLRVVSPQVAVASSGFDNAFRHPSLAVQKRLAALQIPLLRTDRQGGLVLQFEPTGVFYTLLAEKKWWHRKPF